MEVRQKYYDYLTSREFLVRKIIREQAYALGILDIEIDDIYQELFVHPPSSFEEEGGWRKVKNKIKVILRQMISNNNTISLDEVLYGEDGEEVIARIDMLRVEDFTSTLEEDETVERVEEFLSLWGPTHRAIAKLLLLGFNQRAIAQRLGLGLDEVAAVVKNLRTAAEILLLK